MLADMPYGLDEEPSPIMQQEMSGPSVVAKEMLKSLEKSLPGPLGSTGLTPTERGIVTPGADQMGNVIDADEIQLTESVHELLAPGADGRIETIDELISKVATVETTAECNQDNEKKRERAVRESLNCPRTLVHWLLSILKLSIHPNNCEKLKRA